MKSCVSCFAELVAAAACDRQFKLSELIIASYHQCRRTSQDIFTLNLHVERPAPGQVNVFCTDPELKMNPSSGARSGKTFVFTSESVGEGHSGTVVSCVHVVLLYSRDTAWACVDMSL